MEPSLSHHQVQYGVVSGEAGKPGSAPMIWIGAAGAAITELKPPRAAKSRTPRTTIFVDIETEEDLKTNELAMALGIARPPDRTSHKSASVMI
jgi:hypothetical protein